MLVSCPDPTPLRGERSCEKWQHSWVTGRNLSLPIYLHSSTCPTPVQCMYIHVYSVVLAYAFNSDSCRHRLSTVMLVTLKRHFSSRQVNVAVLQAVRTRKTRRSMYVRRVEHGISFLTRLNTTHELGFKRYMLTTYQVRVVSHISHTVRGTTTTDI